MSVAKVLEEFARLVALVPLDLIFELLRTARNAPDPAEAMRRMIAAEAAKAAIRKA